MKFFRKFFAVLLSLVFCFSLAACGSSSAKKQTIGESGTIACIGDSITFGAGVLKTIETESYPALLKEKLGEKWEVINYGNRGSTLLSGTNHPYKEQKEYEESLSSPADVYIIMLGTNDAKEQYWDPDRFRTEYVQLIEEYRSLNERALFYLMLPPTVFAEDTSKPEYFAPMGENVHSSVVDCVKQVAEEQKIPTIDLHTLTADHPEWFADGLHPNADGNRAIVDTIYSVLVK